MNSFGRIFRVSIFGESHGSSVGIVLDGVPSGIELYKEDFTEDLMRRKPGTKGTTTRIETDDVCIESGVFNNYTTGAPILLKFLNQNTKSKDYSIFQELPRPSHADFTAHKKYNGFEDYRGGGHFSGRLTTAIVAAGVVAKKIIKGIEISSRLINLGGESDESKYETLIDEISRAGDSIGGIIQITIANTPIGLGEPYFDSVESCLSHLLFSIGGIKGVEFGAGFSGVELKGSQFNDSIVDQFGHTKTNNNGGINGGITNGNDIVVKVFVKPTPSIFQDQETFNFKQQKMDILQINGRHDAAIVLRAAVVLEAMCAIGLADLVLINKMYK